MKEFKVGKGVVRIHGQPDREKLKEATRNFVKKVNNSMKQKNKEIA